MLEGFEKFTKAGGSYKPKISIRKRGQMGFSNGAVTRYSIDDFNYVVLYISNDKSKIAIKLTNDEKEEGAIKLVKKEGNFCFSGKAFLDYYDLPYNDTVSYDTKWSDADKVIVFELSK